MSSKVLMKISNLQKAYGKNLVLNGISTEIRKGEVIAIIGPSGYAFRRTEAADSDCKDIGNESGDDF